MRYSEAQAQAAQTFASHYTGTEDVGCQKCGRTGEVPVYVGPLGIFCQADGIEAELNAIADTTDIEDDETPEAATDTVAVLEAQELAERGMHRCEIAGCPFFVPMQHPRCAVHTADEDCCADTEAEDDEACQCRCHSDRDLASIYA